MPMGLMGSKSSSTTSKSAMLADRYRVSLPSRGDASIPWSIKQHQAYIINTCERGIENGSRVYKTERCRTPCCNTVARHRENSTSRGYARIPSGTPPQEARLPYPPGHPTTAKKKIIPARLNDWVSARATTKTPWGLP